MAEDTQDTTTEETTEVVEETTATTAEENTEETTEETPVEENTNEVLSEVPTTRSSAELDFGEDTAELDVTDEDRRTVSALVAQSNKPILETLKRQADENDLRAVYLDNPAFKKYDSQIRERMAKPEYVKVPIIEIAAMFAGRDPDFVTEVKKQGAEAERRAAEKVKTTKTGGANNRPVSNENTSMLGGIDVDKLNLQEVRELANRVTSGQFKI